MKMRYDKEKLEKGKCPYCDSNLKEFITEEFTLMGYINPEDDRNIYRTCFKCLNCGKKYAIERKGILTDFDKGKVVVKLDGTDIEDYFNI